jgi:hypothetical protein
VNAPRKSLSIRPRDFGECGFYTGITELPGGDLEFSPSSYRTPAELDAVRLLWATCPALRNKLQSWVVDGLYGSLACNQCKTTARIWRCDCRCRLLSLEYAFCWLEDKFEHCRPLYVGVAQVCLDELLSTEEGSLDRSSSRQIRRSPRWRDKRSRLGPPGCVLLESDFTDWKTVRQAVRRLEYRYGLALQEFGVVQLLHPCDPVVYSLFVGPGVADYEWQSVGARVLERDEFSPLFNWLQSTWRGALNRLSPEERGFREAELGGLPLVSRRGIFSQSGLFPECRAVKREWAGFADSSGSGHKPEEEVPKVAGPGDPCPRCRSGYLCVTGLYRDSGDRSGTVGFGPDEFPD